MTFVFDGRFDKFLNGIKLAFNVTVKLVGKSFQIDIQSIDVRKEFIGILSNETAVGHNHGFQSGFMEKFRGVSNKLKTHRRFVVSKSNTDISGFLLTQVNGKICQAFWRNQAVRAVVRSRHRDRSILAVGAAQVAPIAAVRKDISSGAETHQRLLFDRIQG